MALISPLMKNMSTLYISNVLQLILEGGRDAIGFLPKRLLVNALGPDASPMSSLPEEEPACDCFEGDRECRSNDQGELSQSPSSPLN